ncbi:hypothetical protein SUGI_0018640 [Cryptomeria japonica]|nr:hypothetical protein SUGI_0018640 [Cryptomeria japonica]
MLNSGNFVLLSASSEPIWQSFDNPTDTLLPGQTLKVQSYLFSKPSTTNYFTGQFQLFMQMDGNLVLYPMEGSRRNRPDDAYWSTGPLSFQVSLKFDANGLLYLVNNTNMTISSLTERKAGNGRFRVTLESDGILAQYVWNISSGSWLTVWQPVDNTCKVTGQCGTNGICQLDSQNKPDCICPPQFTFIDIEDHFKGCMRSTSQGKTCSIANSIMYPLENIKWLDGAYAVLPNVSESECQEACREDCFCVVVTYENTACSKQQMPLMSGRQGVDITNKAFVKVYEGFTAQYPSPSLSKQRKKRETKMVIAISISVPLLREEAATEGFREELGRGSFGKVYKGALPDGRAIAMKTLVDRVEQEEHGEREFRMEMKVIGTSHHRNLVQLYGFCVEGSHRILVYEYMSNGSLDTALFVDSGFLDWSVRVQIAMGIARGIRYLHKECRTQILHCDIKPPNILLDQNYNPKISDFGLAKLLRVEQTRTFTAAARGTPGYIAPEWWINSLPITVKVDVYSFGTMLLEIICCRKSLKLDVPENQILLDSWIYECLEHGNLSQLVEQQQDEGVTIDLRQLERMVLVGLWCIQQRPHLRPSINNVVQMIEGKVEIAVPPTPVPPPPVLPPLGSLSTSTST